MRVHKGGTRPTGDEFELGVESVHYIRCMDHRFVEQLNQNESCGGECGACIAADYRVVARERLERALPEKDCCGRRYERDEHEDIVRHMLQAAKIQRDHDERQATLRRRVR